MVLKTLCIPLLLVQGIPKQTLLIMKLTAIILLSACLTASANGFGQTISLSEKDASLSEVFKKIEKQTDFTFAYTGSQLSQAKRVTVEINNGTLEQVLALCFKDQPFTYTIIEKTIVVKPKTEGPNIQATSSEPPPIDIKGRVLNEKGEPLEGVTVTVKGTKNATATDANGAFELKGVDQNATLVFSGVNVESYEIKVNGKTEVAVDLKTKITTGEAVTVVSTGYQDIPKERATGSFDFINNEDFNRKVSSDILSRLQGMASGLLFDNSIGNALGISIRGRSTIFANTTPLIILDNFPYTGNINDINPNDIESVTILKDAAASSIWGARSGNGVIVIATKKGKYNTSTKVSFNSSVTFSDRPDLSYSPNMTSSDFIGVEQFLFNKGYYDNRITSPSRTALTPVQEILLKRKNGLITSTDSAAQIDLLKPYDVRNDYSKYLYQRTITQQYSLNLSGGELNHHYYFSVGFDKNSGSLKGNENNRITLDAHNTYALLHQKLELSVGILYTQTRLENNGISPTTLSYGNFVTLYPYAQLADNNGTHLAIAKYRQGYIDTAGGGKLLDWKYRPLDELNFSDDKTKAFSYQVNAAIIYKVMAGLTIDIRYQYGHGVSENEILRSQQTYSTRNYINQFSAINWSTGAVTRRVPLGSIVNFNNNEYTSQNFRSLITYEKKWSSHQITALIGNEINDMVTDLTGTNEYGYDDVHKTSMPVDYLTLYSHYISGQSIQIAKDFYQNQTTDRYVSVFGNASYVYKDRYTLSASARKDASNLFGVNSNQKWVPLWSVGAAWDLSEEQFYKISWLPYLRIRATYGYNGNVDKSVTAYLVTSAGANNTYGNVQATVQNPPNPSLRWEKTSMATFGVDYSIKGNRISGTIEYYRKKGVDLMGSAPLAPSTGLTQYRGNTADMKAYGFDVIINTKNIIGTFQWTTNFLFSQTKNWVTNYKVNPAQIGSYVKSGDNPVVGRAVAALYSYRWGGLDPQTGDPQGILNKTVSKAYGSIINSTNWEDMVYNGRTDPSIFGSLLNTFSYRGAGLSFNLTYKLGYYFRRSSINYSSLFTNASVGHKDFSLRWQKPGDEKTTDVPSMIYPPDNSRDELYSNSEVLVEKADHIRWQDIQVSYVFNKLFDKKLPVQSIKAYLYINRIGILWKANKKGVDPDFNKAAGNYNVPLPVSYSFGLRVDF